MPGTVRYAVDRAARALIAAIPLVVSRPAIADDDEPPAATPYRPTVSTPAALSAPHWLEGEFGGLLILDRSSGELSHRASAPYALKYAFTDDWGIRIIGEGIVHASDDGQRQTGFGDTGLVAKRRFAADEASAFGLELGALFPTTRPALHLGSGKTDYSVNGIYSVDALGWHADLNVIGTRLGATEQALSRWQGTGALALSHPLSEQWSAGGEFSGTRQHGTASTAQFLGSLAFAARRDLVFDFGAIRRLNRATPTWQAFAGATVVIGRVD